jgi:hypothetical protein
MAIAARDDETCANARRQALAPVPDTFSSRPWLRGTSTGPRRGRGHIPLLALGRAAYSARFVRGPVRAAGGELLRVARASTPTHAHLRDRLALLVYVTVILDAVASVLILLFERHANRTEITSIGDALFWTSTQLLTVSSQLPNPISTPARVLDVFLQAYAISIVAILAGSFGAFFHRRGMERDPPEYLGRISGGS